MGVLVRAAVGPLFGGSLGLLGSGLDPSLLRWGRLVRGRKVQHLIGCYGNAAFRLQFVIVDNASWLSSVASRTASHL